MCASAHNEGIQVLKNTMVTCIPDFLIHERLEVGGCTLLIVGKAAFFQIQFNSVFFK